MPAADHALVEAAVRVGVVVGDLNRVDDPVHVLLDLLGRGFYIRAFSHQGVLVRVLAGIGVDHGAGVSGAVARAIVPRMIRVRPGVDEELEQLVRGRLGPLLVKPETSAVDTEAPVTVVFAPVE